MIDQNQKNLDGEVSEYEHNTKVQMKKHVCQSIRKIQMVSG